jgi:hypothetical protein
MTNRSDETTADKAARRGMTPDEYRAHRHLAAVRQIRAALPGLYATTGLRVEAALTEPAAVSAAVEPPADQTALRDRIAEALATADGWDIPTGATMRDVSEELATHFRGLADAVLAVLPAPADRATVLREAADQYAKLTDQNEAYDREQGELDETARLQHGTVRDVVAGLRRMADETATETPSMRLARQSVQAMTDTFQQACPPGCVACATDESHDPEPAAGARQDGSRP